MLLKIQEWANSHSGSLLRGQTISPALRRVVRPWRLSGIVRSAVTTGIFVIGKERCGILLRYRRFIKRHAGGDDVLDGFRVVPLYGTHLTL